MTLNMDIMGPASFSSEIKPPPGVPPIPLVMAATYALAAYHWSDPDPSTLMADKCSYFSDGKKGGTEGFVGSNSGTVIAAFAGTDTLDDWMINSMCKQVEIELPGGYILQVHKGF